MLKKPLKTENLAIPFYLKYRSIALVIEIPLLSHLYYLKCRRISWFHDLVQTVKRRILVISLENTTWYSISPCWFLVSLADRRVLAKDPKSPRCPLLFIYYVHLLFIHDYILTSNKVTSNSVVCYTVTKTINEHKSLLTTHHTNPSYSLVEFIYDVLF